MGMGFEGGWDGKKIDMGKNDGAGEGGKGGGLDVLARWGPNFWDFWGWRKWLG